MLANTGQMSYTVLAGAYLFANRGMLDRTNLLIGTDLNLSDGLNQL